MPATETLKIPINTLYRKKRKCIETHESNSTDKLTHTRKPQYPAPETSIRQEDN